MIPVPWYIRFLPHAAIVLAVLAGVWYLDHRGYARAQADRDAADAQMLIEVQSALRKSEQRLAVKLTAIGKDTSSKIAAIDTLHTTVIQPTLVKELAREVRFSDPALGINDSVRGEINRALSAVACTARTDGGIQCALPAAAAAPE